MLAGDQLTLNAELWVGLYRGSPGVDGELSLSFRRILVGDRTLEFREFDALAGRGSAALGRLVVSRQGLLEITAGRNDDVVLETGKATIDAGSRRFRIEADSAARLIELFRAPQQPGTFACDNCGERLDGCGRDPAYCPFCGASAAAGARGQREDDAAGLVSVEFTADEIVTIQTVCCPACEAAVTGPAFLVERFVCCPLCGSTWETPDDVLDIPHAPDDAQKTAPPLPGTTAPALRAPKPAVSLLVRPDSDPIEPGQLTFGTFSAQTPVDDARHSPQQVREATAETPEQIGKYEILERIGGGAMGVVFLARDPDLERRVVIKMLPGSLVNDQSAVGRMLREASLGALLRHPNLCRVVDANRDASGFYFVMEHAPGQSLGVLLRDGGPLAIPQAARIGLELFQVLMYLADQNIVHRDVKPGNIVLAPDGGLKLLDLGLGKKLVSEQSAGASAEDSIDGMQHTMQGTIFGTPDYMAPEQAADSSSVTPQTDVYAAGITLYHMLTGRLPFEADTVSQKIMLRMSAEPADPRVFRTDLPGVLRRLLLRLLSREPAGRPKHADVIQTLSQFTEVASVPQPLINPPAPLAVMQRLDVVRRQLPRDNGDEIMQLLSSGGRQPRLGEYLLLERLGPRSVVNTYRAQMPHGHVECIIRILPPGLAQQAPRQLKKLLIEQGRLMQISSRSSHLAGLTFLGRAEFPGGLWRTAYYTVETLVEGACLRARLERGERLSIDDARRYLWQALLGLIALHDHGIIHGNVHAGKIIIDDQARELCLTDLSRAQRLSPLDELDDEEDEDTRDVGLALRRDWLGQELAARRQYLAPEILCEGASQNAATEQYALGVSFIEAVGGAWLRSDPNDLKHVNLVRSDLEDRLDQIADASPRFAQLLRKMVKPNPASRFANLRAAAAELKAAVRRKHGSR